MALAEDRDFTPDFDSTYTGLGFETVELAFAWIVAIANDFRFDIVKSSRKKRINMPGEYQHYFTCACAKRSETEETKEKRLKNKGLLHKIDKLKRRLSASKRVGCQFRGVVRLGDDGDYNVIVFEGRHDHPLNYYKEGMPRHTRLTPLEKLKIREMYAAHCKPKVIVDLLQQNNDKKPFLRKPVYNEVAKFKKDKSQGRNPAGQFFHLARARDYFTRFKELPHTKVLTDLFWSHPNGRKMLRCYPNVICIDATYGTNKYNYALVEIIGVAPTNQNFTAAQALVQREDKESYMWVMECLKELLVETDKYPTAIVTDRELGLMDPIATVFPHSHHVLCMHHVKKMIRAKAIKSMKTVKEGESLFHGAVTRLLESVTEEEYDENERQLRTRYGWVPNFIKYMDDTWIPHKEKIVHAWTDKILHYGNITTNRVESAHSAMKDWIISCRGGLDTLFDQTHAEVEGQTKEIRSRLEQSLSKNLEGFDVSPYMLLLRRVSHYCLIVLKAEATKKYPCTHAFRTTHGLPCYCDMLSMGQQNMYIDPNTVDRFWTNLVYDQEHLVSDQEHIEHQGNPFNMSLMVADYNQRDVADQYHLGRILHSHMYPEHLAFQEPLVNVTKKGRPAKGKNKSKTKRELSHWEHVDKKFATGPSSQASNCGTDGQSVEQPLIIGSWDVPEYVRPYLVSVDDVLGDGNCGFRCAALKFLSNEDMHVTVRMMMVAEIGQHRDVYKVIYQRQENDKELENAIRRINWRNDRCTSSHWMQTPCDLFAMAQVFRAVISLYSDTGCCTVFPWRGTVKEFQHMQEMSIIYRPKMQHFVLGHFWPTDGTSPDNPLPTVHPLWASIRNRGLGVWMTSVYAQRLSRYKDLQQIFMASKGKARAEFIDLND